MDLRKLCIDATQISMVCNKHFQYCKIRPSQCLKKYRPPFYSQHFRINMKPRRIGLPNCSPPPRPSSHLDEHPRMHLRVKLISIQPRRSTRTGTSKPSRDARDANFFFVEHRRQFGARRSIRTYIATFPQRRCG